MDRKCDHVTQCHPTTYCRKAARVMVKYQWRGCKNDEGTGIVFRCWSHYVRMEDKARHNQAAYRILGAVIYGPNEQRETENVKPQH